MLISKRQVGVLVGGILGIGAVGLSLSPFSYGQTSASTGAVSAELSCLQSLSEAQRGVSRNPSLSFQTIQAPSSTDNTLRDFSSAIITQGDRVTVVTPTGVQGYRIPPAINRQTLYVVPLPGARETFPVDAQGNQPAAACRDPRSVVVVETTGSGNNRRMRVIANNTATPELLIDTSGGNPRCTAAYPGLSINPTFAGLANLVPSHDSRYLNHLNIHARIDETPQASQAYVRARISDQITLLTRDLQQLASRNNKAVVGNNALMRPMAAIDPVPESIFARCNLTPAMTRQLAALRRPANRRLAQLLTHNEITVTRRGPDTNVAGSNLPRPATSSALPPEAHTRGEALQPAVLGSPIVAPSTQPAAAAE